MSDAESRLAAARAARAELARKRAEKAEASQAEALAAAEEQALADEVALAAAEDEHGADKVACVQTAMGAIIVKCPEAPRYRRFVDSGKATVVEFEKLVLPCCVYPDAAKRDRMLEAQPAVIVELAGAVCRLAGAKVETNAGK